MRLPSVRVTLSEGGVASGSCCCSLVLLEEPRERHPYKMRTRTAPPGVRQREGRNVESDYWHHPALDPALPCAPVLVGAFRVPCPLGGRSASYGRAGLLADAGRARPCFRPGNARVDRERRARSPLLYRYQR